MGLSILLSRKYRCLPTLLTELVDKKRILCGSLTTSCSLYGKKNKNSGYEHVDQEKHGDLVHRLTSCKDSYQTPESLFEDSILYGPASKYKPPAQGVVEPKFPRNWIPLTNPNKSALPQKTVPGVPLQISLQRNRMASVTTVLQLTMPLKQAFYLERWKQQMILELGKEGFAEYTKNIFQQGKLFHGALEALLLSEEILEQEEDCSVSGYVASVQHVLQDVTRVRALESAVQHETLHYKGLVDCVAEYRLIVDSLWLPTKMGLLHILITWILSSALSTGTSGCFVWKSIKGRTVELYIKVHLDLMGEMRSLTTG
ncbi:mitochondrial genome maintenance exonuclease 1 isoform X7 [Hemicordylus capensis]|uniref:mitochondrial genome maintenance exonuclease 1 isoform X7 n=1 Tax=Hemicordylus capensis TaxID=884348 RepID=UPI00230466D4|nr:mitochondrial genome maintenance exonuclease 1 isoform X7 [Hemicordylus capensis]